MDWAQSIPSLLAAFMASLVESIEALTVILAAGVILGWAGAMSGAVLALGLLLAAATLFGPLLSLIPVTVMHLGIGLLLLVFGLRWLRKAVLRAAGAIPLRDETLAYARQSERLAALNANFWAGAVTTFQVTLLEGVEVLFIVLAIGADRRLLPAAWAGAGGAVLLVVLLGLALHRPLARIPENTLKFAVGVLACAFGIFWLGEGLGVPWPGGEVMILGLDAGVLACALIAVRIIAKGQKQAVLF